MKTNELHSNLSKIFYILSFLGFTFAGFSYLGGIMNAVAFGVHAPKSAHIFGITIYNIDGFTVAVIFASIVLAGVGLYYQLHSQVKPKQETKRQS
jgi:hypothetical protein